MNKLIIGCALMFFQIRMNAQSTSANSMDFEKYDPVSTLIVPEHKLTRAKFPFIDVHNHQWDGPSQDISRLAKEMDQLNMRVMINLSGRGYKQSNGANGFFDINSHDYLVQYMATVKREAPGRLMFFTNISFVGFGDPGWTEKAVRDLENDVKSG